MQDRANGLKEFVRPECGLVTYQLLVTPLLEKRGHHVVVSGDGSAAVSGEHGTVSLPRAQRGRLAGA